MNLRPLFIAIVVIIHVVVLLKAKHDIDNKYGPTKTPVSSRSFLTPAKKFIFTHR